MASQSATRENRDTVFMNRKESSSELLWLSHGWMLDRNSVENCWMQATDMFE